MSETISTFNSEEWMDFSSKNPGNNKRKRSTVMPAMAVFDGRFFPSRWLMPPTRA